MAKSNPKMHPAMTRVGTIMAKLDARCMWQAAGPNGSLLDAWAVGTGVVIVQYFKDGGCTHYVPGAGNGYDAMETQLHQLDAMVA